MLAEMISQLEAKLPALVKERDAVDALISDLSVILHPARTIPHEILSEIFTLVTLSSAAPTTESLCGRIFQDSLDPSYPSWVVPAVKNLVITHDELFSVAWPYVIMESVTELDVDVDVGWGTRQKAFKQIPSLARALTARHRFSRDHESYASFNSEFTFTGSRVCEFRGLWTKWYPPTRSIKRRVYLSKTDIKRNI